MFQHTFVEFLSLIILIQVGQLSVTGKNIITQKLEITLKKLAREQCNSIDRPPDSGA